MAAHGDVEGPDLLVPDGTPLFIQGSGVDETLIGGAAGDQIYGDAGADTIFGGGGADRLAGWTGNDTLDGGDGDDQLYGEAGDDVLYGQAGDNYLNGGTGFDVAGYVFALRYAGLAWSGDLLVLTGLGDIDVLADIERLQFSDGALDVSNLEAARGAYDGWFGRDPSGAELTYWGVRLQAEQASQAGLEATLATAGEGRGHLPAVVTADYQAFLGRAPSAAESAYWVDALGSGAVSPTQAQGVFAAQPGAAQHEADAVAGLYGGLFGRAPTGAEDAYWAGRLASGGTDLFQLRETLLSSMEGEAHTDAVIAGDYAAWFGRAPGDAELAYWEGQAHVGLDLGALRGVLANAPEGRAHTDALVAAGYQAFFGRAPSAGETGVWEGLIAGGHDFNEFVDTLQSSAEANGHVVRKVGTATAADYFSAPNASGYVVVSGFTPASSAGVGRPADHLISPDASFDPLAHAVQTDALDGGFDVLITYNPSDTVLLKGVSLAALSPADFLYG